MEILSKEAAFVVRAEKGTAALIEHAPSVVPDLPTLDHGRTAGSGRSRLTHAG